MNTVNNYRHNYEQFSRAVIKAPAKILPAFSLVHQCEMKLQKGMARCPRLGLIARTAWEQP